MRNNNTKITNLQFNAQEISRFEHGTLNVAALEVRVDHVRELALHEFESGVPGLRLHL